MKLEIPSEYQQFKELKAVFVGGCVHRGEGSRFRAKAHAHTDGKFKGWLCFLSSKWLGCRELWLHEIAHLYSGCGHTDKWRRKVEEIGGTIHEVKDVKGYCILRSYEKRTRQTR